MEKLSYALGMIIGQNLKNMGVADLHNERFAKAVEDVIKGNAPEMTGAEANKLVSEFMQKEEARAGEAVRTAGENFLKENAGKEGVVVLPSGLQYKVLTEGKGKKPKATDQVKCHSHRRHGLRQQLPPRRTRRLPPQRRDCRMDRRRATHGRRRQIPLLHPLPTRLRHTRRRTEHPALRSTHL